MKSFVFFAPHTPFTHTTHPPSQTDHDKAPKKISGPHFTVKVEEKGSFAWHPPNKEKDAWDDNLEALGGLIYEKYDIQNPQIYEGTAGDGVLLAEGDDLFAAWEDMEEGNSILTVKEKATAKKTKIVRIIYGGKEEDALEYRPGNPSASSWQPFYEDIVFKTSEKFSLLAKTIKLESGRDDEEFPIRNGEYMQMMWEACGDDDVILKCSGLRRRSIHLERKKPDISSENEEESPIGALSPVPSLLPQLTPLEKLHGVAENIAKLPEEERRASLEMLWNIKCKKRGFHSKILGRDHLRP